MSDANNEQLKKYKRKRQYFRWSYGLAILFLLTCSLFSFVSPFGQIPKAWAEFLSKVSLGISTAFFTAAFIQHLRSITLDKNAADDLTERISNNVRIANMFSPFQVYAGDADSVINKLLLTVSQIRFFGTSAKYFFDRLIQYRESIQIPINISLLLHNPSDESNINIRSKQMEEEHGSVMEPRTLKEEVIIAIVRAFYLSSINTNFRFEIRLHSESPAFRLEFYGEHDLFLEFYNTAITKKTSDGKGTGPIAHYNNIENNYMYRVFNEFYYKFWDKNRQPICTMNRISLINTLSIELNLKEEMIQEAIKTILDNPKETDNLKEWLKGELTSHTGN